MDCFMTIQKWFVFLALTMFSNFIQIFIPFLRDIKGRTDQSQLLENLTKTSWDSSKVYL